MPYITQEERNQIDPYLDKLLQYMGVLTPGQFVYIMYQLAQWQASFGGTDNLPVGWGAASRVVADMECAKLEFYRRVVVPYENKKIQENGDCIPPRANSEPFLNYTDLTRPTKEKVTPTFERKIDPFDMSQDDISSPQGDGANREFNEDYENERYSI